MTSDMNARPRVHAASVHTWLMLFRSIPLFVMFYRRRFFIFSSVFLFTPPHPLSPSSNCLTLSLAVFLSLSLSLPTVKPFQGPSVLKHQKLSCQMQRGGEEWILFTADQKDEGVYSGHFYVHTQSDKWTCTLTCALVTYDTSVCHREHARKHVHTRRCLFCHSVCAANMCLNKTICLFHTNNINAYLHWLKGQFTQIQDVFLLILC